MSYQYPDGSETRGAGQASFAQLQRAGFHAWDNVNVGAVYTMGSLYAQNDAIWAIFGHANAGLMETRNWQGQNYLYADSHVSNQPPTSCSSPNTCLNGYTSAQLHQIRLMIFGGCHTANSNNGYVLPQIAINKGVDSSIGWTGTVESLPIATWADSFFNVTTVVWFASLYTTFSGAIYAENIVLAKYGQYYGTDTSKTWGPGVHLSPIGYGS